MTAEDEFRKVGEDVRELARALRSELRAARQRAREQAAAESYRHLGQWVPPPWTPRPSRYDRHSGRPGWWAPPAGPYPGAAAPGASPPGAGSPGDPSPGGPSPGASAPGAFSPGAYGPGAFSPGAFGPGASAASGGGVAAPPGWAPPTVPAWAPPPRPARPRRSRPERPPVRHRRDGSTLLSVLLVLVGLAWLGSQSGVFPISTEAVLAVVLALVGAAMVVTARTDWALSRRAWPVLLGAGVLATLLISTSVSSLQFGPQERTLTTWSDAATRVDNFAGPTSIDLTQLRPGPRDGDETLRINETAGPVDLTVPAHPAFHIHVHARSRFGPVNLGGSPGSSGVGAERSADFGSGGSPTLDVEVTNGAGPVTVHVVGA